MVWRLERPWGWSSFFRYWLGRPEAFRRREKLRFYDSDGVYGICNVYGIWFGWRLGGYFIESIMIESNLLIQRKLLLIHEVAHGQSTDTVNLTQRYNACYLDIARNGLGLVPSLGEVQQHLQP